MTKEQIPKFTMATVEAPSRDEMKELERVSREEQRIHQEHIRQGKIDRARAAEEEAHRWKLFDAHQLVERAAERSGMHLSDVHKAFMAELLVLVKTDL